MHNDPTRHQHARTYGTTHQRSQTDDHDSRRTLTRTERTDAGVWSNQAPWIGRLSPAGADEGHLFGTRLGANGHPADHNNDDTHARLQMRSPGRMYWRRTRVSGLQPATTRTRSRAQTAGRLPTRTTRGDSALPFAQRAFQTRLESMSSTDQEDKRGTADGQAAANRCGS